MHCLAAETLSNLYISWFRFFIAFCPLKCNGEKTMITSDPSFLIVSIVEQNSLKKLSSIVYVKDPSFRFAISFGFHVSILYTNPLKGFLNDSYFGIIPFFQYLRRGTYLSKNEKCVLLLFITVQISLLKRNGVYCSSWNLLEPLNDAKYTSHTYKDGVLSSYFWSNLYLIISDSIVCPYCPRL